MILNRFSRSIKFLSLRSLLAFSTSEYNVKLHKAVLATQIITKIIDADT